MRNFGIAGGEPRIDEGEAEEEPQEEARGEDHRVGWVVCEKRGEAREVEHGVMGFKWVNNQKPLREALGRCSWGVGGCSIRVWEPLEGTVS